MKFLWNNASRRSRQSFLWRRPSGGIVYPFQIWEGSSAIIPTFAFGIGPAWNTVLSGPAYKYLNLLSAPAGNTLNELTSIGATEVGYYGIVTLPPLAASLSVTLNFSISHSATSISSPTVRSMNLGYPYYDADQLTYLNFPKWEVGSFSLNNFNSVSPSTTRFSFPEYRGNGITASTQDSSLFLNDNTCNFDFPKLVALYAMSLENSDPDIYPFTCTFPVLTTVGSLYITQYNGTGSGNVINLPALTTITSSIFVRADSFYAPLLTTFPNNATSIEFGVFGARLNNLNISLTVVDADIIVYFATLTNAYTFNLFGNLVTLSRNVEVYVNGYTFDASDLLWSKWASALTVGGVYTLSAPSPTGANSNADVIILTLRGYTCIFTS
jgi:hypothetical protein